MTGTSEPKAMTAGIGWALACCLLAVLLGWTEAHADSGAPPMSAYLDAAALFGLPLAVFALLLGSAESRGARSYTSARARYGENRRREALTRALQAGVLFACVASPLVTLGLLGTPGQVPSPDLRITLEVTWLGVLALYGVGLWVRAWAGRLGMLFLLIAEWATALPTETPLPLLPTAHMGHLLAVGPELATGPGWSFLLLAATAMAGVGLASLRVRP